MRRVPNQDAAVTIMVVAFMLCLYLVYQVGLQVFEALGR